MGDVARNISRVQREQERKEVVAAPKVESPLVEEVLTGLQEEVPFPEPGHPGFDAPDWPRNLADLSDEDLGEHMSYWTAMVAYASYQLAIQDADRKVAEARRDRVWNESLVALYETNVTVSKAKADSDPEVIARVDALLRADTRYRLLQSVLQGFEQRYQAVSREVTRRLSQRERRT